MRNSGILGESYQFSAASILSCTLSIDVSHNDMIVFIADTIKFRQRQKTRGLDQETELSNQTSESMNQKP